MRMILFDRGGIVDEYASVPEFHGPLPPGEVVALHANPVVVERYTGRVAGGGSRRRSGRGRSCRPAAGARAAPAGLAGALGLSGAEHGWADAPADEQATRIDR